ncbi:MAG: hypothetical protein WC350_04270 [Candidatus Micrarchaeia archaeon]|jgi:hypothetical protein
MAGLIQGYSQALILMDAGCADSRGRGTLESLFADIIAEWYAEVGIIVVRTSVLSAGTFATRNLIYSLKRELHENKEALYELGFPVCSRLEVMEPGEIPLIINMRMTTHAHAHLAPGVPEGQVAYLRKQLKFVRENTCINCGMEHAGKVWTELMAFLMRKGGPEMEDQMALLEILRNDYGFDGYNPMRFIKSVDDHRMHVGEQAAKVRAAFRQDAQLSPLINPENPEHQSIFVTEAVLNYGSGAAYRLDNHAAFYGPLEDMAALVSETLAILPEGHPERVRRTMNQEPTAMAVCSPSVLHPRKALSAYLVATGQSDLPVGAPGSVFAISGHDAVGETYTFGPHAVVSFFYAAKHLKIRKLYLVGTEGEILRMRQKIRADKIVRLIVKESGMEIVPVPLGEMNGNGKNSIPPVDRELHEAAHEAIRRFSQKLNARSPLVRLPAEKFADTKILRAVA